MSILLDDLGVTSVGSVLGVDLVEETPFPV